MAKEAMRQWQARLAERMHAARSEAQGLAWLAVECRGRGLLFPLTQAGEVFTSAPTVALSHSRPWFKGVANLRGRLHAVVDLADFLGLPPEAERPGAAEAVVRDQSRYVAFGAAIDINCALQVDRLCGLRQAEELQADASAPGPRPPFAGDRYRDTAGRAWQEIDMARLADDESFLAVAAERPTDATLRHP